MIRDEAKLKARLTRITKETAKRLDLDWQMINVNFDASNGEERILCSTESDWEYRQATLTWNLVQAAVTTDDLLRATAVHELVHVLTAPLWNSIPTKLQGPLEKLNELATENVARAILAALG